MDKTRHQLGNCYFLGMSTPLFQETIFLHWWRGLCNSLAQGMAQFLGLVNWTIFEGKDIFVQFLRSRLTCLSGLYNILSQGWLASLDCAIQVLKASLPSNIAQFMKRRPTKLQSQGKRWPVFEKVMVGIKTRHHKHYMKYKALR